MATNDDDDGWQVVGARPHQVTLDTAADADVHDVDGGMMAAWRAEQRELRERLVADDLHAWNLADRAPRYIGGVDLSFIKGNNVDACACLVVLEFPSLKVVYKDFAMVKLELPYIAGFLAFREVPFLVRLVEKLRKEHPYLLPDVIMVDGNGILHHRGFGLASHLGVLIDIPTIGIGKKFLCVDGMDSHE